jgi:uncharacterized protein with FMN-binding domain
MKTRTLRAAGVGAAAAAAITTAALPVAASAATKHYTGKTEQTPFGNVQVTITVKSKKIKTLSISASPDTQTSYQLESYALPRMRTEALKASSYKIHTVSGVTITSEGFIYSLYSAMAHAHIL